MIKAVVIPPALDHPLCGVELNPYDFAAYQGLTGGNMQTYELCNPSMTLYSNGVSVTPLNIRATLILWVHNRDLAYHTMVAGQAILAGNDEGADVDVPEEIMELIFEARRYKVEVDGKGGGITYEELSFAYAAAIYHRASPAEESEVRIIG